MCFKGIILGTMKKVFLKKKKTVIVASHLPCINVLNNLSCSLWSIMFNLQTAASLPFFSLSFFFSNCVLFSPPHLSLICNVADQGTSQGERAGLCPLSTLFPFSYLQVCFGDVVWICTRPIKSLLFVRFFYVFERSLFCTTRLHLSDQKWLLQFSIITYL